MTAENARCPAGGSCRKGRGGGDGGKGDRPAHVLVSLHAVGRREPSTGIQPFRRLVAQVMGSQPYASARRVFWVVDNGSSHRGAAPVRRLAQDWPRAQLVHTPVHSSWLNQVEIFLSIVQRKCLTPNDFPSLAAVHERLVAFQRRYEQAATPFHGSSPAPTSPS